MLPQQLKVGTTVYWPYEGDYRTVGRIVGYNHSIGLFYGADRYPYLVSWDDGYTDVYNANEFRLTPLL